MFTGKLCPIEKRTDWWNSSDYEIKIDTNAGNLFVTPRKISVLTASALFVDAQSLLLLSFDKICFDDKK